MIEDNNKQEIQKNCPHCHILSQVNANFDPIQDSNNCPEEHLKTHIYEHKHGVNLQGQESVEIAKKSNFMIIFPSILKRLYNIIKRMLFSKQIWEECPDPCSLTPLTLS